MHMHHELATLPSGTGDTDTSTIDRLSLTMQSIVGSLEEKECEVPLPPRRMMFTFFFSFLQAYTTQAGSVRVYHYPLAL